MKRWAFNIAAGLSLVLCVAMAAIWARSYWCNDAIGWGNRNGTHIWQVALQWERGTILCGIVKTDRADEVPIQDKSGPFWRQFPMGVMLPVRSSWNRKGFIWQHEDDYLAKQWVFGVPCWLVMILVGTLPALWLPQHWQRQRRFRRQHGLCLTCGYDLRASKDRCPECGNPVPEGHMVTVAASPSPK